MKPQELLRSMPFCVQFADGRLPQPLRSKVRAPLSIIGDVVLCLSENFALLIGRFGCGHFNPGQIALICVQMEPLVKKLTAAAKERQRDHGNTAPGKKSLVPKSAQVSSKVRDQLAETFGIGHGI